MHLLTYVLILKNVRKSTFRESKHNICTQSEALPLHHVPVRRRRGGQGRRQHLRPAENAAGASGPAAAATLRQRRAGDLVLSSLE